jgi:hypothetical protein
VSAALLLSALIAALVGFGLVRLLWPAEVAVRPYRVIVSALAIGIGLGVTGIGLLLWLLVTGGVGRPVIAFDLALLGAVMGALRWRSRRSRSAADLPEQPAARSRGDRLVTLAFAATLTCAVAAFVAISASAPHGGWDAWMNWNLRARMIFRSGAEWREAFSPLLGWSHPDYPLLVQSSVVRMWAYCGVETLAAPATVAFLFTFATVGLASSAVTALRGRTQGMLAGLVLLSTPFLIFHGASQYADVPVGFFFLSTVVLLALHDRHRDRTTRFAVLAGLTVGLAGWTKNEGLLFLAALAAAQAAISLRPGSRRVAAREIGAFGLGLLPMLVIIGLFKLRLAPANDLVSSVGAGETLRRLTDPIRYGLVVKAFVSQIGGFGFNGMIGAVWLLITYGLCVWVRPEETGRTWFHHTLVTLGLVLAGHAVVFVATADDVARLLDSSLERLLLQLWPAAVFTCFMVFATPEEAARALILMPPSGQPPARADPR